MRKAFDQVEARNVEEKDFPFLDSDRDYYILYSLLV